MQFVVSLFGFGACFGEMLFTVGFAFVVGADDRRVSSEDAGDAGQDRRDRGPLARRRVTSRR
jgi:hypothetical protein